MSRERTRRLSVDDTFSVKRLQCGQQYGVNFHVHGDTAEKRGQRKAALDHLMSGDDGSRWVKMLSLPGESWALERDIHFAKAQAWFVACERDDTTFMRSIRMMPRQLHRPVFFQYGVTNSETVDAVDTGKGVLVCCTAQALLSTEKRRRSKWGEYRRRLSDNYNTFWLDGFSAIGTEESVFLIRRMVARSSRSGSRFAFAFNVGRDDQNICRAINACPGDAVERRAAFLQLIGSQGGRQVHICGVHRHPSFNEDGHASIGTVFGTVAAERKPVIATDAA